MKKKMVWELAALFTMVLLLFTVVLGGVFLMLFRQHTIEVHRNDMEKKAISIADMISYFPLGAIGSAESGHGEHESEGYSAYLRIFNALNMGDVWIVDQDGDQLSYGHHQVMNTKELPQNAEKIVQDAMDGRVAYGNDFSGMLGTPSMTVGVPVTAEDGSIIGAVLLHSPVSGINDAVKYGAAAFAFGTAAAMLLAVAAAVLASYFFTRPLRRMKDTALKLADGDYTAQTCLSQKDEMGELAGAIDFLAGKLEEAQSARQALDKMKQDFVANVSHELRTPVAVLRGSLEVLSDGTVSDPGEVEEYHEQMLRESRHMERLVNDLLDLSRLQDDAFVLDKTELELGEIARDAARAIRQSAREKELTISLCGESQRCEVYGDYVRIRQLLLILLDNAVKFSEQGKTVCVGLQKDGEDVVLSVANKGIAIPKEELPHIFERFHKMNSPANRTGTGLGLPIAAQIAQRHNARICARCREGVTTFLVTFHRN